MRSRLALGLAFVLLACLVDTATQAAPVTHIYMPVIGKPTLSTKFGLAGCPASCVELGCAWCYDWSTIPGYRADMETVPMLWHPQYANMPVRASSAWLMGFNEPDLPGQANLTPQEGATAWRAVEAQHPERKLLAPAPSHLSHEWLPKMRALYLREYGQAPRFDALAVHCYWNTAQQCIDLLTLYEGWAREWGVPEVWVTEFAFLPAWTAQAEQEARTFVAYLEAEPMVTRYAVYTTHINGGEVWWPDTRPGANPSLLAADGKLTEIGQWYKRPAEAGMW